MAVAMSRARDRERPSNPGGGAAAPDVGVAQLKVGRSDLALAEALRRHEPWARAALYDRYAAELLRMLRRLVAFDADIDVRDVLQEVFVEAFTSAERLHTDEALRGWLRTIAVRSAYRAIRRKRARRWLRFWEPARLVAVPGSGLEPELLEAYRRTCALLVKLPDRYRVPFSLRYVEGWKLEEIALSCGASLATTKRRIERARAAVVKAARGDDRLAPILEEGSR